ncbi:hypothetical protein AMJ80_04445 [bacterium SM23_31]|nr:MAG: hypothetical protein AMJ80_04445 [bacterium SM23_31]
MKKELMFSSPAFRKNTTRENIPSRIDKIFSKSKSEEENSENLTLALIENAELKSKLEKLNSGTKKDLMKRIEELEAENESLKQGVENEYSTQE